LINDNLPVLPDPQKPSLPLQPKTTAILAPFTATFPFLKIPCAFLFLHRNVANILYDKNSKNQTKFSF
jgi:hypothetical protein